MPEKPRGSRLFGAIDGSGDFTVSAPKAGTRSYTGTQAMSINASGTIAGYYLDTNGVAHGFIRY